MSKACKEGGGNVGGSRDAEETDAGSEDGGIVDGRAFLLDDSSRCNSEFPTLVVGPRISLPTGLEEDEAARNEFSTNP